MATLANNVSIQTPEALQAASGVKNISVSESGDTSVTGPTGAVLANLRVTKTAAGLSGTFTRAGGQQIAVEVQISHDGAGNGTVKGTWDGAAFSATVTPAGKLVNGAAPKNLAPQDAKILSGLESSVASTRLTQVLPIKPSPFIPETEPKLPKDKAVATKGTATGGPVASAPLFHRAGCALAGLEIIASAILLQPEGIAFGLAGYIISC